MRPLRLFNGQHLSISYVSCYEKNIVCCVLSLHCRRTLPLKQRFVGTATKRSLSHVHNEEIFSGKENPLIFARYYESTFSCDFKLARFPFDTQACEIPVSKRYRVLMTAFLNEHWNVKKKTFLLKSNPSRFSGACSLNTTQVVFRASRS